MSVIELTAAALMMAVGAVLQGAVGFGGNLVAVPVLLLIEPDLVPGPALVGALTLNLAMISRERDAGDLSHVRWALVGRIVGTVAGALAVASIPGDDIAVFFAVVLLGAIGLSLTGFHLAPSTPALLGAGTVSGFMATAVGVGGPPMALIYQRAPGPVIRGALARLFAVGIVISIVSLTAVGEFGGDDIRASAALVPGVLVGFAVSGRFARVLDGGYTRPAVLVVSAAAAVTVLVRQLA